MYLGDAAEGMDKISYAGYRFRPGYSSGDLALSQIHTELRDVEDLLAERGISVSHRAPLREPLRADDRRVSAQAPCKTACDLAS